MTTRRCQIPGQTFSMVLSEDWDLTEPPTPEQSWCLLRHRPSGTLFQVREEPAPAEPTPEALEALVLESRDWGAHHFTHWQGPGLLCIAAQYPTAMPGTLLREWFVTDGRRLVNVAGYPTDGDWRDVADEVVAVVRTIKFGTTR